jgi:hypothetical protein
VETIAVRIRYRDRVRAGASSGCIRCGSCRPPRAEVGLRDLPLVAVRSRSSIRFRVFFMISLPFVTPPKQQQAD